MQLLQQSIEVTVAPQLEGQQKKMMIAQLDARADQIGRIGTEECNEVEAVFVDSDEIAPAAIGMA